LRALTLAEARGCGHALLINGSPSCGSGFIYDCAFKGTRYAGSGMKAAFIPKAGIAVFSDRDIDELAALIGADDC
jgi:uncharacterized protein YbbK (DUF523 family)